MAADNRAPNSVAEGSPPAMPKPRSGIEQLAPIETASLHQQVYGELRQAIMAGKFRPGESLTLRGLASALGTSIMPARDAVLRLAAERALESSGRGVRIPRFRVALEGEAAALAALRATPEEVKRIEQAAVQATKAQGGPVFRFLAANQAFHFAVYRAARSELLQSMIETLWLQIGPHLALLAESESMGNANTADLTAHDQLVAAIQRKDAEAARAAIAADLRDSVDIYAPFVVPTGTTIAPQRKRA
jgi:DNA-binding GntR family transcriptional regulator